MIDVENFGGLVNRAVDLVFRQFGKLESERHVVIQVHVRIQRIGLKHHGNAALCGRHLVDAFTADAQLALRDVFKSGNDAQQGGFAAARGTHENHELAVVNFKVNLLQDEVVAKGLADTRKFDIRHGIPQRSHAGTAQRADPGDGAALI